MENILEFIKKIPVLVEDSRIILFIIDGLGKYKLSIPGFRKVTYETVIPTSTSTFMYTLHSLLPPSKHCFLEWYMRFRDTIVAVPPWRDVIHDRVLELDKDVTREEVFPFKSLSEILVEKGFTVTYYTPYARSTFSKAISVGANVVDIKYLSQVFPLRESDFTLIYWPSIDAILHERYEDEAFYIELKMIEYFIELLLRKLPKNTKLYILPDHGLIKCKHVYRLPVIDNVVPVGGSRVAFYKNLDPDTVEKILKDKNIPAKITLLENLKQYHNPNRECYERYGETIVIANGDVCFKYPFEKEEHKILGAHGGISEKERKINLWVYTC